MLRENSYFHRTFFFFENTSCNCLTLEWSEVMIKVGENKRMTKKLKGKLENEMSIVDFEKF